MASSPVTTEPTRAIRWRKIVLGALLVIVALTLLVVFRDRISLKALVEHEVQLRHWRQENPVVALTAAFGLYLLATSLAAPTVWPLSVLYGWLFGFIPAVLVVSLSSTIGATNSMLLSRYVLRDLVERRFGHRLENIHRGIEREGAFYLFTLRLMPMLPFFLVNLLVGVTRMRASTFCWVSFFGMLPATCVYVWAGASVPSLAELAETGVSGLLNWQIVVVMGVLACFPLTMRWAVRRLGRGM